MDPELAQRVLARVGDRSITLGDFAQALERMDRFERLRYQTKERRKLLLDEMIDTELLAREAERRGLDKDPVTLAAVQQALREEALRDLRRSQPSLSEFPSSEVQAYFAAHPDEFSDPERRRVSVIAVRKLELASKLAADLQQADARAWGDAVYRHSILVQRGSKVPASSRPPMELAGDLGFVSAPGEKRGENPEVPEPVRAAAFSLGSAGAIANAPVSSAGLYYVVRLVAINQAHARTLSEADSMIRARLLADRLRAAELELEAQLRKQYPIEVNQALLSELRSATSPSATSAEARPGGAL
jgi:hypothetical protein